MTNCIHFLNTFTVNGLGGNPTAVYFSRSKIDDESMQLLATQLSVPVTAFVWQEFSDCRIRYFTGQCEINACGHATLGASAVAAEILNEHTINFRTAKDVKINSSVNGDKVIMKYKSRILSPATAELAIFESLGIQELSVCEVYSCNDILVIVMNDASHLQQLAPDFQRLQGICNLYEEVVVTAAFTNGYDYLLRSFCPWIGINEDPVTGSVQAALGPFWARKLKKTKLMAFQASARGGEIIVNNTTTHVEIGGQTVFLSNIQLT